MAFNSPENLVGFNPFLSQTNIFVLLSKEILILELFFWRVFLERGFFHVLNKFVKIIDSIIIKVEPKTYLKNFD